MSTGLTEATFGESAGAIGPTPLPRAPDRLFTCLVVVVLVVLTGLVYWPVRHHQFVAFDDPLYVTGNRHVQAGLTWEGIGWAFTTGFAGNWHPLTWVSHMLDVQWFGHDPAGPHVVNVLLHVANAALVFVLLKRWTAARWLSALVAALFDLHPLRVESVAWASERKDVLSAFFFLLTLLAWTGYVARKCRAGFPSFAEATDGRPDPTVAATVSDENDAADLKQRPETVGSGDPALHRTVSPSPSLRYAASWVFFTAALMCKPMVVTLPFVLLLLDVWPLRRWQPRDGVSAFGRAVREKLPFFVAAAGLGIVTFLVQQSAGAVRTLASFSFGDRLANVLISYVRYLGKTVWPAYLAAPYPLPEHWPVALALAAGGILLGLAYVIWRRRRSAPFAVVGSLWFGGMLFPTIGLVQLSEQAMADRYTYLPSIGLFVAVVWAAGAWVGRFPSSRTLVGAMAILAVLACAVRSRDQLRYWHDTEALSRHALALTERNIVAHNNLGNALLERGEVDAAKAEFEAALAINPDYADSRVNLGNALLEKGQIDDAIAEFQAAIRAKPGSLDAGYNLGNALMRAGRVQEAIAQFEQAVQRQPDFFAARNNLANALAQMRRWDAAIVNYRAALEIQPDFAMGYHNLGVALAEVGRMDEAVAELRRVTELQPRAANVYNNLGWMLQRAGRLAEAIVQFEKALALKPDYPEAHNSLGRALVHQDRPQDALVHLRIAVKLQPDDVRNLTDLAWTLATSSDPTLRNGTEARELAEKAQRLSSHEDAGVLRVRAAAEAECGRFAVAAKLARRALELADADRNTTLSEQLRREIASYAAGAAFRETMPTDKGNLARP